MSKQDKVLNVHIGSKYKRPPVRKVIETTTGDEIYLTQKHIDLVNDPTRFQILEGKTGSSKSIVGGIAAFHRIFKSPAHENQFAIVGASIDTIERMVIDNNASFYNVYKPVCIYKRSGIGGARIEISTPTGVKKLYLVGNDNAARYKKILGLTISGFVLEEAHVAPDGFIGEMFTRLYRNDSWLISTMNSGLPDQMIYTDYYNKARPHPDYADELPDYMWDELNTKEADPNFRYWFFRFEDNPTMTDQHITDLWGSHLPGSFEYNSKILARRGFVEGLLYARLLDNSPSLSYREMTSVGIDSVYVGIDIGSTDKTVFTMIGVTPSADKVYVIDVHEVRSPYKEQDYTSIITQFDQFIRDNWEHFGHKIKQVRIDRSDPMFINQLRNNSAYRFSFQGSRSDKIVERVTLKQQLLFQNRIIFSDTPGVDKLYNNLKRVRSDGKGGHIDDDAPEIDYSDSFDYSMEPITFRLATKKII